MAKIEDDEPPLDPAVLRVQKNLRRLMLIAGLTLGLGIFAVAIAVIYRLVIADDPAPVGGVITAEGYPAVDVSLSEAGLTSSAELLSVELNGDRMVLVYGDTGRMVTLLIDTDTMAIIGRFAIGGAAQ
jgi:hypothetical protein